MDSECKDYNLFGTDYEDRDCLKCPKYRPCMQAYARKLLEGNNVGGERLGKKSVKEEVQEAVEAVENAKVELTEAAEAIETEASAGEASAEAEATTATNEEKKEKPTKNNELAVRILRTMKTLQKNGITEVTSTILKDRLNTKNRGVIRRTMKILETEGKVIIGEKKLGKRRRFSYKLA